MKTFHVFNSAFKKVLGSIVSTHSNHKFIEWGILLLHIATIMFIHIYYNIMYYIHI